MLKYSVKLTNDSIKQEKIVWGEKYLSPDLSFVTGVTSQDYHLEKMNKVSVSNTILHTPNSILPIKTENVTRQGFIVIKDKEYEIEKTNNGTDCVLLNGKYYYKRNGQFLIDEWLQHTNGLNVEELPYSASSIANGVLKLDTVSWIENGIVSIDDESYVYDFDLRGIRMADSDTVMNASAITKCSYIEYYPFSAQSEYEYMTKFMLTKGEEESSTFENVSFIKYFYYILYKDNQIIVYKDENNDFACDVPSDLLDETEAYSNVEKIYVYTDGYVNGFETTVPIKVNDTSFDILNENLCYAIINDVKYEVYYDILNANDGDKIAIYLNDASYNINVGDIVYFIDDRDYMPYSAYSDDKGQFILFRSERYDIVNNLCDKANIDGKEYEIEYVNGKVNGKECIVKVGDASISMTINGNRLKQKGLVVIMNSNNTNNSAETVTYPIVEYSGVTIDENKYPIYVINDNTSADINIPNQFKFIVRDIQGSSMLICEPYLNSNDLSEDFIKDISSSFCDEVVSNQSDMLLYFKNNIFGNREITKELAINSYSGATSSDDYFDLFDNLTIYSPNGYIHISLSLNTPHGNNLMQDDIVNNKFYEREKEKAINPIIDMEKDIYYPKYFESPYSGSSTDFNEIGELRFNLHFRTRDMNSWKVNEDYNNKENSGLCNWFITDYYPYKFNNYKGLDNCSDLVYFLGFTNNDVYYQKSKIAKSFLRLSFYDSTDQQTQNLLGTSTIFMNEHKLFKKFIDNSRKGLFNGKFKQVSASDGIRSSNKISVNTEYGITNIDDEHRLGCEFIVNNKYEADASSEGYYIYIFREYSEKLTPKPIYMKVEFNHAGFGRTIPFIIPMKWTDADSDADGNKYPNKALDIKTDLNELKKGIKLEDSYAQSYIPLYAVYDFKNKKYAYVFDDRYVTVDKDNGSIILNLFEIKFANDTETSTDIQKAITMSKQPTAKINMNTTMFPNKNKECNK